jgi:hypothetical protein
VTIDPRSATDHHTVAYCCTAGHPNLGNQNAMTPYAHIVANLNQIVDLGAFADHRVIKRTPIDGGVGTDFDMVLNDHTAYLRDLEQSPGTRSIAKSVLTYAGSGMNDNVGSYQRMLNRNAVTNVAVAADTATGTDGRACRDDCTSPNFGFGTNDGTRLDCHAWFQPSGRINVGSAADGAGFASKHHWSH